MKPRLLYVVTLAEVGGAQSYVRDLLPAVRSEYDVTVAAHGPGPLREACSELGIPFVALEQVRRKLSPRDVLGVVELFRLFRRLRPDLVHLNSSKAGWLGRIAARIAGVPVVLFTAHGWAFRAKCGSALYRLGDRIVEPLTTMVICVSQAELDAGIAAKTCRVARSAVIPNAVDTEFEPPLRNGLGEKLRIVSVGRLADPKNFGALIRAAALLPPGRVQVQILGDGPQRDALTALIESEGLDGIVSLVGEVRDVRPYLADAHAFVLSTFSEGMPIALLEAMAAGLPVVASAVSGVTEVVVDEDSGLLVPPDDVPALAAAIRKLLDDVELRTALGDAARRRAVEHFSLPAWRATHLDLYRALRNDARPSRADG
jgi:glycosyltransferase involved in cell wall biosynthesis